MNHRIWVLHIPTWADPRQLLGPGDWHIEGRSASTELPTHAAADVDARLRRVGLDGRLLELRIEPPLPRAAVRAARTTDARRRRETSIGFSREDARLDEEGKVSLTPEAIAADLGGRVAGRTVLDAGCGAGGNAIGFARAGCVVTAIERDGGRLALARHNARVYGVADRIRFLHGDATHAIGREPADVLFVDPPWGVDWSRARTTAADLPLLEAAWNARGYAQIWAKVPPSFEVATLDDARPEAVYGVARGDARRVKFVLLRRYVGVPS